MSRAPKVREARCREPTSPGRSAVVVQQAPAHDGTIGRSAGLVQRERRSPDAHQQHGSLEAQTTPHRYIANCDVRIASENPKFIRSFQFELNMRMSGGEGSEPRYQPL